MGALEGGGLFLLMSEVPMYTTTFVSLESRRICATHIDCQLANYLSIRPKQS